MSNFLHISEAANLALHALILLASEPTKPWSIRRMGQVLPKSENHLAKVLQRLARSGLVASTRGPQGGFVLAKTPEEVTLLEVYEVIEGKVEFHACLMGNKQCLGECILGDLATRVNVEIRTRLERTRLSDVSGLFGKVKRT